MPGPSPAAFPPGGTRWRSRGSIWHESEGDQDWFEAKSAGGLLEGRHTLLEYLLLHLPTMALPPIPRDSARYEMTLGNHRVAVVQVIVQEKRIVDEFTEASSPVQYLVPAEPGALVAPWQVRCGPLAIGRLGVRHYQVLDWE